MCGIFVTISTHLRFQTKCPCFGDLALVRCFSGVHAPSPYSFVWSVEHCALGQDAYMGMTVVLLAPREMDNFGCVTSLAPALIFALL